MADEKDPKQISTSCLYYPNIRGIAQPIRNLFYYLNTQFKQISINDVRQIDAGFNSGYPKLVQDELQLTDAIAIFRHLCRYYQRVDLLGLTPQNRAVINQFMFHNADIRSKIIKRISEGAKLSWTKQNQGQTYELKMNILKSIVEQQFRILKDFVQYYMKNKNWLFGYLTIADFFFYEICFYLVNFLGSVMKNNLVYRNFQNYLKLFESQEFFVNSIENINSKKIFMPFKDKSTFQIMLAFWEGDKNIFV